MIKLGKLSALHATVPFVFLKRFSLLDVFVVVVVLFVCLFCFCFGLFFWGGVVYWLPKRSFLKCQLIIIVIEYLVNYLLDVTGGI